MADYSKLQNGSDVRGVALAGVPGEPVPHPGGGPGHRRGLCPLAGRPDRQGCP